MEAKEVMVGDWVKYGNRFAIIKSITPNECCILVSCGGSDELVWETYDNIEPILIIPDILEKNGWEKRNDACIYYDSEYEYQIIFMLKEYNYTHLYNYIDASIGCITIREMPITYLHELQNLMRLCGIKKEIEL